MKSQQGVKNFSDADAAKMTGDDPDFSTRDVIEKGDFPKRTMFVQVMKEADADTAKVHPFDLTKVWPHADYPLHEIGVMELNRNVENYFAEVEQASFEPSNVARHRLLAGQVLQNRVLSYSDAHRYRLGGANYHQIRVNQPKGAKNVATYHCDGAMQVNGNYGDQVDYGPNSFGGPVENPAIAGPPLRLSGDAARYEYKCDDEDYYGQPRLFWEKVLDKQGRKNLVDNIVGSMTNPMMGITDPRPIQERMLHHWYKIHPDFGGPWRRASTSTFERMPPNSAALLRQEAIA